LDYWCVRKRTLHEKEKIMTKETNKWNVNNYNKHADFVSTLGMPVVDLLAPQKGEKILDLGCGDGTLALELEKFGAEVMAADLSEEMVAKSREKGLNAHVMSATQLPYEKEFDAVFSNAVLHWVKESSLAVEKIYISLKEGGRFVAEFGGEGNIEQIRMAMKEVFSNHKEYGAFNDPWFFPSVESYENILKLSGFKVEYIERIPRPTPIDDIAHWLDIFANGIASDLTEEQKVVFKSEVREILKNKIYTKKHGWVADYVRLRVRAMKV